MIIEALVWYLTKSSEVGKQKANSTTPSHSFAPYNTENILWHDQSIDPEMNNSINQLKYKYIEEDLVLNSSQLKQ